MATLFDSAWRLWIELWPHILAATLLTVNIGASLHALLTKRDTRSTMAWVGLVWLSPGFGAAAYALFGVNRIRRKATRLRAGLREVIHKVETAMPSTERLTDAIGPANAPLRSLATLVGEVTKRPLLDGNTIQPLHGGDEAYPQMLEAIDSAKRSIGMASYIFDNDPTGKLFIDALCRAVERGVSVRVLIDGIGSRYSFPTSVGLLRQKGVPVSRFMPTTVPLYLPYANLRNHRKILVIDGERGFTGGLNIRNGCWLSKHPDHAVQDMHFALTGPVVTQLLEVFIEDWAFASGESLGSLRDGEPEPTWQPSLDFTGRSLARGVRYGPDDHEIGRIKLILIAALSSARRSVKIMTPYFLPDDAICQALGVAALRGVKVDIVLPEQNNLALVGWASDALLWQG
ncbi:MAG TPA: cardiolipin synthase, partial [Planctomycetaceae bacterium]|nr:cardiolipin synthase [Planctomycetaceae bacterium]